MGSGSLSTCGKITKLLFLAVNFLYLLIGLAVIAVGSYLVHTGLSFSVFTGNHFFSGAAILIICGMVITIITAVGIVAAFIEKKWLLYIYVLIVLIIIVLEIVATILGFVFRNQIADKATSNGVEAMSKYLPVNDTDFDRNINDQIDSVQETLECCGWNNTMLWLSTPYYEWTMLFPESCECMNERNETTAICIPVGEQMIYNQTCDSGLTDRLRSNVVAIGIAGVVFAIIQVIPVLLALAVIYAIHKAKDSYVTV